MSTGSKSETQTVAQYILVKTDPVEKVRNDYNLAKDAVKGRWDQWQTIYLNYYGYISNKYQRFRRANFHFHKLFPQIELEAARYITGYFTHKPHVAVLPNNENSVEAAKNKEQVQQYYYEHSPSHYIAKLRWIKYALLYGCGFCIPTWKRITHKKKTQVPLQIWGQETSFFTEQEIEEVVYEGLWFDTYSPTEVFPDPYGLTMDQKRYVIIEEFVPVEDLLRSAKQGAFDESAVNRIPLNSSGQNDIQYYARQAEMGYQKPKNDESIIRLQHRFAPDHFITLANDETIIRDIDNPFDHQKIPVIQSVKSIDPDSFWPIGSARMILTGQKLVNLFVNLMADSAILSAYPVWKHKSGVDPGYLLSVPNQRIPVEDMDDVDIIRMPEMKHDLMAIKTIIEANIEECTGFFGPQKGYSTERHTATSDSIFAQEGDKRVHADVMTLENIGLLREAKISGSLIDQFMPEDVAVRVTGPTGGNFQHYGKEDLRGEYYYRTAGISESINRSLQKHELIELFKLSSSVEQYVRMVNGMVVPVPLQDNHYALKQIYEALGRQDAENFVLRPEVFGDSISNETLGAQMLPPLANIDNLYQHRNTGAMRNQPWPGGSSPQNAEKRTEKAIQLAGFGG